jgi:hypothetical protein
MPIGINKSPPYEGGCVCGAVRYRIDAPTIGARICHCRICQKSMAAPFAAQASFPASSLTRSGNTERYRTSQRLYRHFCPTCGTRVFFEPVDFPDRVAVPVATLDDPSAIEPEMHIWISSKLEFVRLHDELPKYEEGSPEPYRSA